MQEFRGELAAIGAAMIWAAASLIYTSVGRQLSPLLLNLVKGGIAIVLLLLTLIPQGNLLPSVSGQEVLLLLLSGAAGIGFGDTAYFAALNRIGARRTLVIESLAPPLSAVLALVFLQEFLPLSACWGIALTIAGVTWVVLERLPEHHQSATQPMRGVVFGILSALGQSGGAVLSRMALAGSEINPLWSTLVRLLGGVLVLLVWLAVQGQSMQALRPLRSRRLLATVALTAFVSTYLGIWLQQISLKYAATGIAQSLSATSPLFVIPLAIALGEKVSLRAILGVLMALTGVWFLFHHG